jgi:predicted pyridoxine 5'-phosphate oxidase superfamily flavin-nucleotide-binding protein
MMVAFHDGELAVQRRAGVAGEAQRLVGVLAPPSLDGGAGRFLRERTFAALTARDRDGRLWTSPLAGPRGFLDGSDTTLRVHAVPAQGDPLHGLAAGRPVGMIAIDFATRRRLRVNGTLTGVGDGLEIDVDQAFGNCPQYIQQRSLDPARASAEPGPVRLSTELDPAQAALIRRADTFLLGTAHPQRGVDTSHRGGAPGFVRVNGNGLWWPDYPGNNMFNSMGNIAVDGSTSLLFPDFATGTILQLSGTATIDWVPPDDEGGTGRRVSFAVDRVVEGCWAALHTTGVTPYPRNPLVAA